MRSWFQAEEHVHQNHGQATCLENARSLFFPGIEKDYGGQGFEAGEVEKI